MKKKLLRMLLTIMPLSLTPLIAASCGSKKNHTKKPSVVQKNLAIQIKDKITTDSFAIKYLTNTSVTNPLTVNAIKTALKGANKKLTASDLTKITFTDGPLKQGTRAIITCDIAVDGYNDKLALYITMGFSPANEIKDKITQPNFSIPFGTNTSITNSATSTAIKAALKNANPKLSDDDLAKITLSGGPLVQNTSANVTATISDQGTTATETLSVTMQKQTWTQSPTSKGIPTNAAILKPPVKINNTYYLGTDGNGLYTSTDGKNWTQSPVSKGIPTTATMETNVVKINNVFYLGTDYNGLYTSTDGVTWDRTNAVDIPTLVTTINTAPVQIGGTYYLSTAGKGLWTSTDGKTWTQSPTSKGIPTNANLRTAPVKINGVYYLATTVGNTIGVPAYGLYTSTDGSTWDRTNAVNIPTNEDVLTAPVKIGNTYYLGTNGDGLWTSLDGKTWTKNTSITTDPDIKATPVEIGNIYYLSTAGNGLYTSTDGVTWDRTYAVGLLNNEEILKAPVKIGNVYYLSTIGDGLYTSTDGKTWTEDTIFPNDADVQTAPVKIDNVYYLSVLDNGLWISETTF